MYLFSEDWLIGGRAMKPTTVVKLRRISQLFFFIFLVLFITGTVCAFSLGGKQVFTCTLGMLQLTLATRTLVFGVIVLGLAMIVITLAFGRIFCSWICPFGTLLDWLEGILKKVRLNKQIQLQQLQDHNLLTNPYNKYGVLAGTLISAGILRTSAFCIICPVGGICRAAGLYRLHMGLETLFIPIIAGLSFIQKRFWCKYLCPIGALLALTDRISFSKVKLPAHTCLRCGRCEKVCNMDVSPWSKTHKALKKDPLVIDTLMEIGLPDFLDKSELIAELLKEVQNILLVANNRYPIPRGECTHCYECTAICPLLNEEKDLDLSKDKTQPLSA